MKYMRADVQVLKHMAIRMKSIVSFYFRGTRVNSFHSVLLR